MDEGIEETWREITDCVGPAHLLEMSANGDSGMGFTVTSATEVCLRNLWDNDTQFRSTFLDWDADDLHWQLQVEECLTSDEATAFFADGGLPSASPYPWLFEEAGPEQWWPGGSVVGRSELWVEMRVFAPPDQEERLVIESNCWDLSVSPDGRWVAYDESESAYVHSVWIVGIDGENNRRLTQVAADPKAIVFEDTPAWSPDGEWIAFVRPPSTDASTNGPTPGGVYLVHPDGSGLRQVAVLSHGVSGLAWSASGTKIVMGGEPMSVLDVASGEITPLDVSGSAPAWSLDETQVAYIDGNRVWLWSFGTSPAGVVPGLEDIEVEDYRDGGSVDWSPDGAWLIVASVDYGLLVVNPDRAEVHRLGHEHAEYGDVDWYST
jgi:WD40 repeat protein